MDVMSKASIGMVIGSRAARACDVCGKERARWYCAADEAYLCERCDGSVHTANSVAKRHDRVRLGPNGAPMKIERSAFSSLNVKREALTASPVYNGNSRKRPRSIRRQNPSYSASRNLNVKARSIDEELFINGVKVKAEPGSPDGEVKVPDHSSLLESLFGCSDLQDDDLFLHEVPIYMPLHQQQLPPFHCEEEEKSILCGNRETSTNTSAIIPPNTQGETGLSGINNSEESLDFLVPGNCIDIEHFLDSENDLCSLEVDVDCNQDGNDGQMASMDSVAMLQYHESSRYTTGHPNDDSDHANDINDHAHDDDYDDNHGPGYGELYFDTGCESPRSWLCKVKVENPPEFGLDAEALLSEKLDCQNFDESQQRFKLGLNLNFQDVLTAWSGKGSLWMDGQRPEEISFDCLGGWMVPDMSYNGGGSNSSGEQAGQVPVLSSSRQSKDGGGGGGGGAREARVMRYREKRRTRLFSKKIRYEVRKLNAEKRPRMKGRFVKRTPGMV